MSNLFAPATDPRTNPQAAGPVPTPQTVAKPTPARSFHPNLTPPNGPPVPVLMQHGFYGGIGDFAHRVQTIVDAHTQAYQQPPSPQLTLDLARSQVPTEHFTDLFSVPNYLEAAQAKGIVNTTRRSGTALVQRHDGYLEPDNPARRLIYMKEDQAPVSFGGPAGVLGPSQGLQPSKTLEGYQALQKQHPWVAAGTLPLPPDLLNGLWSALDYANKNPDATKPLTVGGETIQEYRKQSAIAAEGQGVNSISGAVENPALVSKLANEPLKAIQNVTTVKEAQLALKKISPTFFSDLDPTGYINSDWQKAIGKYQTTPAYFRRQTQQLAHDNHFGSDTGAFIKAWEAKQAAIKNNPGLTQLLRATPLAMFSRTGALKNLIFGDTKGLGWANVPTWGLGSLVHTAGLALTGISGTIESAKADTAYVNAYLEGITPKQFGGYGQTEAEARAKATSLLLAEHPSVIHIFDPTYTGKHDHGIIGGAAEVAFDLALGAPRFTGERIAAGDFAGFKTSRYVEAKTNYAYNALLKGDVGGATKSLEGGLGAERLNVAAEQAVRDGSMSLAEYQHHVASLYHRGTATIGDKTVDGSLFRSLRTKNLPTPGPTRVAASQIRQGISRALDDFENTRRINKDLGATNHAADFIASTRQLFARSAPGAERRYIYDERLPEDVYNWARVNLKDQQLAQGLRDEIIRLRAADNIQGVAGFGDKLRALYAKAHPDSEIKPNPVEKSGGPELESESRTFLSFPKSIETTAQKITARLNSIGRVHREVIVGGSPNPLIVPMVPGFGESLMYKHAIADTTRRVVGGGGFVAVGPELKATRAAVQQAMRDDPSLIRQIGVSRSAAKMGETRWITGSRTSAPESYRTGEHLGDTARMDAAGSYLRHNLSSDALKAYQASTPQDLGPLIKLVLGNRTFRALAFKDESYMQREAELRLSLGDASKEDREKALKALRRDHAHSYSELLYRRYKELEEAGHAANVADPLNEALNVLIEHVGPKADRHLGKWVKENKLDFPVRDGLVEQKQWDDVMQKWVGVLMTANKWNRGQLFDHVFYSTVKDLTGAGWEMGEAVPVAADLAKAQTVYHMLDFANMLQVEQNLRWLSYFATKHRLYWTWILRQARQRPGLAAAINDAKEHLDDRGNLNFSVAGHQLTIPAARLFWVNAKEYPQTSPLVQAAAEYGKGVAEGHGPAGAVSDALGSLTSTSGNLITRDDQAEMLWVKTLLVKAGALPATSEAVTFGMSPTQKTQFQEDVNRYSAFYRAHYGHWPLEPDAVKWALLHGAAQETWRTNLFVPILVNDASATPPSVKKEMDAYSRITDPARKRKFLDSHPDVALRFGVSKDPAVYLHNNVLWDKYNTAHAELARRRDTIYQSILTGGYTLDTRKQMKAVSEWWSEQIDALKLEDATTWAGSTEFKKGQVSDGQVVTAGPWGVALEGDPLASRAFVHEAFPRIGDGELNAHTVGQTVVELQKEAARLRAVGTDLAKAKALGYPDLQHVHDRLSQVTQAVAPFFGYPKDAPSQIQASYYSKFVGPYIKERDKMQAALALAPSVEQDALRSQFRAWKDEHDHPVYLEWKGQRVKFPSVVQIGWATLPQAQRTAALALAAADDWAHVASYEKTMLGVPTSARVGEGWAAYETAIGEYNKHPEYRSLDAATKKQLALDIDKQAPGFYKDWLFQQKPKVDRYLATSLYKQIPDRRWFTDNVLRPAQKVAADIKANGSRSYYEKAWRNAVETQIMPAINTSPDLAPLRRALLDYGPDFLNTLVSVNG